MTVCIVALVLRHVTVAPLTTVSVAGSNLSASDIVTVAAVVAAGVLAELAPVPAVAAGAARGVAVFDGAQAVTNVMIASNIPTCSRTSERCNAFTRRTSRIFFGTGSERPPSSRWAAACGADSLSSARLSPKVI